MSFTERLGGEELEYFTQVTQKPFSEQAVAFLNAYWNEVHTEAEFIFTVAWETIKRVDMESKGLHYLHQYEEGRDLDFDMGLHFYEMLCRFVEDPKNARWRDDFPRSQPEMLTAIKRKQELREKVDVNFDGRVAFIEYLLYQYRDVANPADFCTRSMSSPDEHPEVRKARLALEDVNKRIREYEAEKARLEEESKEPGVKGLRAKNMLAQLDSSPLREELNKALITAEAAVRIATKKFGGGGGGTTASGAPANPDGAIWWMNRDLQEKQAKYAPSKK